jgi:hypothetical protein
MNIRGLNNILIPAVPANTNNKQIKSDVTDDRDAAGQYFNQKQKKPMTDEEFNKALENLNKKSFMIEMNWTAKKIVNEEIKFAQVTDASGEVIRTISEYDMWELFSDESTVENNKGNLLKKVA